MKRTKILSMILALGMVAALAACGGTASSSSAPASSGGDAPASSGGVSVNYPTKSINMIVPYAAGGSSDMSARPVADKLGSLLGQPVVVVNKPGAGGAVGAAEVYRSKPDGYTMLNASIGPLTIAPYSSDVGYTYEDFKAVSQLTDIPIALAVHKDSPIQTLDDFIAAAKANPGSVQVGNVGAGNIQHLAIAYFANLAGIEVTHVPYEGANPAVAALLGQHVDSICVGVTELTSHYNEGTFRVLAQMGEERLDSMPDVPTFKELGYDDAVFGIWYGIVVPKETPDEIVDLLDDQLKTVLEDQSVLDSMEKLFLIVSYQDSEAFSARIASDAAKNKGVLESLGMAK